MFGCAEVPGAPSTPATLSVITLDFDGGRSLNLTVAGDYVLTPVVSVAAVQ